jgi:hypothetical protein
MHVELFLFPDQSCRVVAFPLDFFLEDLYRHIFGLVESNLDRGQPTDKVAVIKADIASAVQRFVDEKDSLKGNMRNAQSIRIPRSPVRSSISDESVVTRLVQQFSCSVSLLLTYVVADNPLGRPRPVQW